ncbi:MAG: DNA translocase FtsK [Verrucomicrobia bacterium]|nr:DNA translocase FtsK [Verrucomicrobiota bacterium]
MDLGWVGILMFAVSFLYILSLLSYNPSDPPLNPGDPTDGYQNMIGPVGAYLSYISFMAIGFAAYMVPLLLMLFGAAFIHPFFIHLRQSWREPVAAVVYLLGLMGLLQELDTNFSLAFWVEGFQLGGVLGERIIYPLFHTFGTAGAVIIHSTLILASLYFLTHLQPIELWHWAVDTWESWRERRAQPSMAAVGSTQKTVQRKTKRLERDLAKRKKAVEQELEEVTGELKADKGLGADLKPVPKPTVRDLSVLDEEQRTKAKAEPDEVEMGEVISAEEVKASADTQDDEKSAETQAEKPAEPSEPTEHKAASTGDILGQAEEANTETEAKPDETTGDEAKPDGETELDPPPKPKLPRRLAKPKGPATVAKTPKVKDYKLPKSMVLDEPVPAAAPTETREQLLANARLLKDTLQQFRIEVTEGDITKGPTITRYELHPAPGVKLERISALANNISAAIKAERINILAPVPGRSSVGIEVPNRIKTKVLFRDIIDSPEWKKSKAKIPLALGKDVYGKPIVADLADMPHMLIAGATGSGKSVCINSIVASLLFRFSPEELRFVMIDPKVVELQIYNGLPHLAAPVVHDPKKVILALKWVVNEMEKRYQIFAKVGARNIDGFNSRTRKKPQKTDQAELPLDEAEGFAVEMDQEVTVKREDEIEIPDKLSYIVVIIDELADLMLMARNDVENSIARITQMARAAGIHCIVATQRPSVDVITGVIKANIPARIAFQVAAKVDSRTILDAMGADKLLGKGDMLFLPPGTSNLSRAQGCLVTDEEINRIVEIVNNQAKPCYDTEMERQLESPANGNGGNGGSGIDEDEEIVQQCIEVIRVEQKASVSLMQRRLRLGYTRAARIMDELEDRGLVGPSRGAEPREILFDVDD